MTYIYALVDPRDQRVRYVGKSNDPERRLTRHYKVATKHLPVARWIAKLRRDGLRPIVRTIMQVPGANWQTWERHWIAAFRWAGEELLNITDGSDGWPSGKPQLPETRRRISQSLRGRRRPQEVCDKISATQKGRPGRPQSPETRAKIGAAFRGRTLSPEHRAKISITERATRARMKLTAESAS